MKFNALEGSYKLANKLRVP